MIQKAVNKGDLKHVYCASGGNAGMAAAYASSQLGIPCTIVVPQTTPVFIHTKLQNLGAEVKDHGSMIHESKQQMPETPELVVTCVGGGGLLNGIVQGMRAVDGNRFPSWVWRLMEPTASMQ